MTKKKRMRIIAPLAVWDTAWKLLAIRRAVSRREFGWAAGILVANSVGLVPMYYLWHTRNTESVKKEEAA